MVLERILLFRHLWYSRISIDTLPESRLNDSFLGHLSRSQQLGLRSSYMRRLPAVGLDSRFGIALISKRRTFAHRAIITRNSIIISKPYQQVLKANNSTNLQNLCFSSLIVPAVVQI